MSRAVSRQERAVVFAADLLRALPKEAARFFDEAGWPTPREVAGAGDGHGCDTAICVAVTGLALTLADSIRRTGRRVPPWVAADTAIRLSRRRVVLPGTSSNEAVAEWLAYVLRPLLRVL